MLQNILYKTKGFLKSHSENGKKYLIYVFSFTVIILLVIYIISQWEALINFKWSLSIINLFIALLMYIVGLLMISLAWYLIIVNLGAEKNINVHISVFSKSLIARRIPFPIWFIGSRLYYYEQTIVGKKQIIIASAIEILLTGLSGGILWALLLAPGEKSVKIWILMIILLLVVLILLVKPSLSINMANYIFKKLKKYPINFYPKAKDWAGWFGLYFASWVFAGLSFYYCVNSITNISTNLLSMMKVSTEAGLIGYLSMILPAGFGIKEISTGLLMNNYLPFSIGLIVGILYRIMTTVIEIIWAILINSFEHFLTHKDY